MQNARPLYNVAGTFPPDRYSEHAGRNLRVSASRQILVLQGLLVERWVLLYVGSVSTEYLVHSILSISIHT